MSTDNANGHDDPDLSKIIGSAQAVPVNQNVVQMLSQALDQARRGSIHAVMIIGVNGTDLTSFDSIMVDNMALAMIMLGATEVARSKITQGARDAQQQGPVSKIMRPPSGMRVG